MTVQYYQQMSENLHPPAAITPTTAIIQY